MKVIVTGGAGFIGSHIIDALLAQGHTPFVNGDGCCIRDFVYGPDVARANVAALETTMTSRFTAINIGTGLGVDVKEVAAQLSHCTQDYLQQTHSAIRVPPCHRGEPRSGDLRSNLVSPALAGRLLGWKPSVPLTDGIRLTVKWFAEKQSA